MKTHIVIDGNAFYEIDEECMKKKKQKMEKQQRSEKEGKWSQDIMKKEKK